MMSFPPTPATTSMMSMAGPPRRERRKTSLQLGLEPQTARQMVAKVTQQHEAELHGLKDHMAKENLRHQAEIRRLDHDHKKDVQNIHKEALLQIRALNRFKDCVATLLDRESKFFFVIESGMACFISGEGGEDKIYLVCISGVFKTQPSVSLRPNLLTFLAQEQEPMSRSMQLQ